MLSRPNTYPRDTILAMLEESGTWVSGEAVSARLGISRAAVGKHVAVLRSEGHAIEAVTRKGYRLVALRDAVNADAVAPLLDTRFFGKAGWTVLETTASTNLLAASLAGDGACEGHVVVAERQTRGRGRKGHDWVFVPRSIQFSVLLYPQTPAWSAEAFTRLAAGAVADAIREFTRLESVFKTPNDVLVNGKKVAGVLVETGYRGTEPEWAVVGVGCNVNALPGDFPESVRGNVTSLLAETGGPVARGALLAAMLQRLETAYLPLREQTP